MSEDRLHEIETGDSLGVGSTGEVFEVQGREGLVVKRYHSLAIDRGFMTRNSIRLAAVPNLEGTPRVHDHFFDRAPYEVLMDRVEGRPLSRFGGLKEAVAWRVILRLSEILGHLHKHGVVHGHLHPGNILLSGETKEAHPVVLDVGSGLIGEIHHIDLGESTVFSAPEQLLSGGRGWDEGRAQRWDVYSFGVVAFWLVNDRLPRGLAFLRDRGHLLSKSGGRPVPFDVQAFVEDLHRDAAISWGGSFGLSREFRLYREIIDRCLSLDPGSRPVDLREVRNQFRCLEQQFALEDAEDRVVKERLKQKAKLFGARTLAACLGLSFLGATYYLVEYLRRTYFFQNRVHELDQVVVTQQATIHHLDERWAVTVTDLKRSREAADTFFHRMASGDNAGGSGVAGIAAEDLESSRGYYEKILADVGEDSSNALERARALHSLAHIERKLGLSGEASGHFRDAILAFSAYLAGVENDSGSLVDLRMRLGDSFENLSSLLDNPLGSEALEAMEAAVANFDEVARLKPQDVGNITRLASTAFKLGGAFDAHSRHDEAISAYVKSAGLAERLREEVRLKGEDPTHLTELIGKLQFQTAKSLRLAGRLKESIDAHVSAMETLETLRGVNGFTPVQALQLAESYLELGELFSGREATPEDLDQLFNESLRLITPLHTDSPIDIPVATLLCRSLVHLGELEREEAKWTSGYRLTTRGIEALVKALEANPEHVAGHIWLAEARLEHLKFLEGDPDDSLKLALKGVAEAEKAAQLLGPDSRELEPLRTRMRERLVTVFRAYGEVCGELGEAEIAERCRERAVLEVTLLGPVSGSVESE